MTDLGKLSDYLGIKVDQKGHYIKLKQTGYTRKLLKKDEMVDFNPAQNSMEPKFQLKKDEKVKAVNPTIF